MKVRALKTIYSGGITTRRDEEIEVSPTRARHLLAKKYAVEVGPSVAPQIAEAEGRDDPFPVRPTGGQIGEESAPSSSRAGRRQRKRRSNSQEGDAE